MGAKAKKVDFTDIEYNTSKLMFDPKSENFFEDFATAVPSIRKVKTDVLKASLACYTVLMYDRNSPLLKSEFVYWKRKVLAADLAKFPRGKNGLFIDDATVILTGENKEYVRAVVDFIDLFSLPEFHYLMGLQIIQSEYLMRILRGDVSSDTDKVLGRVVVALKEVTRFIFQSGEEDEVSNARKALFEKAVKERAKLRPEDLASVLAKTRSLPKKFNPYGEDYEPEKMRFIGDSEEVALRKLALLDDEE